MLCAFEADGSLGADAAMIMLMMVFGGWLGRARAMSATVLLPAHDSHPCCVVDGYWFIKYVRRIGE